MPEGSNGSRPPRPAYKTKQKNVSVYLGQKGDWQDEVLQLITKVTSEKESEFFRKLFHERLVQWGLVDKATGEPIPAAMDKLREKANATNLLPDRLDLQ